MASVYNVREQRRTQVHDGAVPVENRTHNTVGSNTSKMPADHDYADGKQDCKLTSPLSYHLKTIWLFTLSDLKTIVIPQTAFGTVSAFSAPAFDIFPDLDPSERRLLRMLPRVAFWTWSILLPFVINNQRQPEAIEEDRINKSWRPMPSGRLNLTHAKWLMLAAYSLSIISSIWLGGCRQCVAGIALGYWYNNYGGSDTGYIVRNFINAWGFLCFSSGAMEVALGGLPLSRRLLEWFCIIGAVVFTTVQMQDFADQLGDSIRGRKTMPIVLGEDTARRITSVPMAFWSWFCPWYWNVDTSSYVLPMCLGWLVIYRIMAKRTVQEDKMTFRVWNVWLIFVYLLPLMKQSASSSV